MKNATAIIRLTTAVTALVACGIAACGDGTGPTHDDLDPIGNGPATSRPRPPPGNLLVVPAPTARIPPGGDPRGGGSITTQPPGIQCDVSFGPINLDPDDSRHAGAATGLSCTDVQDSELSVRVVATPDAHSVIGNLPGIADDVAWPCPGEPTCQIPVRADETVAILVPFVRTWVRIEPVSWDEGLALGQGALEPDGEAVTVVCPHPDPAAGEICGPMWVRARTKVVLSAPGITGFSVPCANVVVDPDGSRTRCVFLPSRDTDVSVTAAP